MPNKNNGSECQTKTAALNTKLKKDGVIKCQNENMALNAEMKRYGGSECQTNKNINECRAGTTTLNAQLNW